MPVAGPSVQTIFPRLFTTSERSRGACASGRIRRCARHRLGQRKSVTSPSVGSVGPQAPWRILIRDVGWMAVRHKSEIRLGADSPQRTDHAPGRQLSRIEITFEPDTPRTGIRWPGSTQALEHRRSRLGCVGRNTFEGYAGGMGNSSRITICRRGQRQRGVSAIVGQLRS